MVRAVVSKFNSLLALKSVHEFTNSTLTTCAIGHFRILGIGLKLACNGGSCGGISLERHGCNLHLKRLPRISLTCKLVPVQYREYENGLLCRIPGSNKVQQICYGIYFPATLRCYCPSKLTQLGFSFELANV